MITASDIARALRGKCHGHYWLCRCPAHDDREPSLSVTELDGKDLVYCHAGCRNQDVIDALRTRGLWRGTGSAQRLGNVVDAETVRQDARLHHANKSARAWDIWHKAVDARGTLGQTYLEEYRGLVVPDHCWDRLLRFEPHCWFGDPVNRDYSALIVAFTNVRMEAFTAIHRIALNADGANTRDANGKKIKMMLGPARGSAMMITPSCDVTYGIAITEGLETGLKMLELGQGPVWGVGSAAAIAAFGPLPGIEAVRIFADNDRNCTGLRSSKACRVKWHAHGCEVKILMPSGEGRDWLEEAEAAR